MLLKIIVGALAVGFLFLARAMKSFALTRKELKNRRKRWDEWAEGETDDDD